MEKLNTKHKRECRQSNEEKYDISGQLSSFRRIFYLEPPEQKETIALSD